MFTNHNFFIITLAILSLQNIYCLYSKIAQGTQHTQYLTMYLKSYITYDSRCSLEFRHLLNNSNPFTDYLFSLFRLLLFLYYKVPNKELVLRVKEALTSPFSSCLLVFVLLVLFQTSENLLQLL